MSSAVKWAEWKLLAVFSGDSKSRSAHGCGDVGNALLRRDLVAPQVAFTGTVRRASPHQSPTPYKKHSAIGGLQGRPKWQL